LGIGNVDLVRKGLEGLLREDSVSEAYVRLRIAVFEAQVGVLQAFADGAVDVESTPLDGALARHLFDAITAACRQDADPGAELEQFESAVAKRAETLEELVREGALGREEDVSRLAARLGVSPEMVVFVARLVAAPFVGHAALRQSAFGAGTAAAEGGCPACGSTPGLASLRPEDGGRVLHCSLCGHAWPLGRLDCPFCSGSDQSALTRLEVADDEARWIEACDRCRHYLKVIDRRRLPERHEFIPLVEEVAGLYLDLVAEREGYLRNPPYAALG